MRARASKLIIGTFIINRSFFFIIDFLEKATGVTRGSVNHNINSVSPYSGLYRNGERSFSFAIVRQKLISGE
jgi:hypothetical protein